MARMPKKELVVALDIGTTKICAIVGELVNNAPAEAFPIGVRRKLSIPQVDIIGIGTSFSHGLRKGVVINIDSTVESIVKAVREAELMTGHKITSVYAGIAGAHIQSFNSQGVVAVKENEIGTTDVSRVIDAAKAVALPTDREVLHVVPQEYIIDDQDGIREPVGMSGVRFEAKVHIVTGAATSIQNIIKCCAKAGLTVSEVVLEPIASAEAVLSDDEKELGVVLVDIGGGTSDIAVFSHGALIHTQVIPIGGNHLTRDIAVGLRTPQDEAEKIKQKYGCSLAALVRDEDTIDVASVGGRKPRTVSRKVLAEIIEPRVTEMFSLIKGDIAKAGLQDLIASGYVLTGGTTMLEGMPELGEMIFEMPVKRGLPTGIGGLSDIVNSPKFSTGVGILKYAAAKKASQLYSRAGLVNGNIYGKFRSSMKGWLRDLF